MSSSFYKPAEEVRLCELVEQVQKEIPNKYCSEMTLEEHTRVPYNFYGNKSLLSIPINILATAEVLYNAEKNNWSFSLADNKEDFFKETQILCNEIKLALPEMIRLENEIHLSSSLNKEEPQIYPIHMIKFFPGYKFNRKNRNGNIFLVGDSHQIENKWSPFTWLELGLSMPPIYNLYMNVSFLFTHYDPITLNFSRKSIDLMFK